MSEELKPCPFCGGEAEIVDAEECGPQAYVVTCNGCMTSSRVIFALMDDVTFDLVSAWNTRADLLPVVKPLVWEGHPAGLVASNNMGGAYIIDTRGNRPRWLKWPNGHGPDRETVEEMQAAAQADHDARIRSRIDMTDPAELVAGAYEAAADELAKMAKSEEEIDNPHDAELLWHMEKRIRALTPADAQDALDAAIAKAVNKKLEEVIARVALLTLPRPPQPYVTAIEHAKKSILAMKEPE